LTGAVALLRGRPAFRSLWAALCLSYAGSGAALVALTLHVQAQLGTGAAVAGLMIADSAPRLLGPVVGSLVDRYDLRRTLIGADLGQAALYAAVALLPPYPALIALTGLATLLQTAYGPARSAAVPALVERDELLTANALTGLSTNLYVAVGPLVGGLLFAAGGTSLAMLVNAATFLASAQLTRALPALPPEVRGPGSEGLLTGAMSALRQALADPVTRTVLLTIFAMLAFIAIDNVALVFLVRDTLGGGGAAYGLVSAVFGVGMLTASLAVARGTALPAPALYLLSLALSASGTLLTGLAPAVAVVGVVQLVSGAGNGLEIVASETILHQRVPHSMLGRVYGLTSSSTALGLAFSMALGGLLVDATSPRAAFLIAAAGGFAVLACAAPPLIRHRNARPLPAEAELGRGAG
jgi:MFS family permease